MNSKSQAFSKYLEYKAWAERQLGRKLQNLRTDNGLEYCAGQFEKHCRQDGVVVERTNIYSPEMNGLAERFNRTVLDGIRTLLDDGKLPQKLWGEALHAFVHLTNRLPHAAIPDMVPEERWSKKKPSVQHLKRYGCLSFSFIPKPHRSKLDNRAKPGIFIGYAIQTRGYRIWFPAENKIIETKHVRFDETAIGSQVLKETQKENIVYQYNELWPRLDDYDVIDINEDEQEVELVPKGPGGDEVIVKRDEQSQGSTPSHRVEDIPVGWRREEVKRKTGNRTDVYYYDDQNKRLRSLNDIKVYFDKKNVSYDPNVFSFIPTIQSVEQNVNMEAHCMMIPQSYDEAMQSHEVSHWLKAMHSELDTIRAREVWELVPKPSSKRILGTRWVYDVKRNDKGEVIRYRARLVAQGFSQRPGKDYNNTYSPVVNFTIIRTLIYIFVVCLGWSHRHLDVKCAYLYGRLEEEIYVAQPRGGEEKGKEDYVCRLKRALYGLKQSGRQWFSELDNTLNNIGFTRLSASNCIYSYGRRGTLIVYVDDIILLAENPETMDELSHLLLRQFEIKNLGNLNYFLGVEFDFSIPGKCTIHQRRYIEQISHDLNIAINKKLDTPLPVGTILSKNDCDLDCQSSIITEYKRRIGILLYIAQRSRPDLSYVVTTLARFSSNPGKRHLEYVERVLCYVCSTSNYGITYNRSRVLQLEIFADASWASNVDDRKSVSGFVMLIGGNPVHWRTVGQDSIALSSMESEYIALADTAKELIWIDRVISELVQVIIPDVEYILPVVYCDNQSAIYFAENFIENNRNKHIDLKYHFVRDCLMKRLFSIKFVGTKNNIADLFTKLIAKQKFIEFCLKLKLL